jgi:type III restriction enzyme
MVINNTKGCLMPRKKSTEQTLDLLQARTSTAPCVPAIRAAVEQWKAGKWKGVTPTTRTLLNYWFETDHESKFRYHQSQREALETLIYLYEVAGLRRQSALIETYCTRQDLRLLQWDDFARYCVKMATGSGKTKVMALAMVWQYFNAVLEGRDDYAKTFLLIAPNVIVFERLRQDFGDKRIFRLDPLIPPELAIYWDFEVYTRGQSERAGSPGALYLTNIQQFYDRSSKASGSEPTAMTGVLGAVPVTAPAESLDFAARIRARGGPIVVLNDEAHHTHDEKLGWNEVIRNLHETIGQTLLSDPGQARGQAGVPDLRKRNGIAAQLDFTATPRHSKGNLFSWTVYDYPLKQAIIDNIVKTPIKGITTGIKEQQSEIASTRYRSYLTAGVERWREYRKQLEPLGKKPLLFIMMNDTSEADDVGDALRRIYPDEFGGGKLLVIHTDKSGEVSKKDLDEARQLARRVDEPENLINCIVSVLMLREGWDVQNVTVVVGLRPYTSKANILPEQAIGRGLRLMFREMGNAFKERVDVIGNKKFIEFVEDLEREEDLQFDTFEVGKDKLHILTILPDPEKKDKDILLPELSPVLARKSSLAEEIEALDVMKFTCPPLPLKESGTEAQNFRYEGYDILSMQKLFEREYTIPEVQTAEEVIGYYAKHIMQDVKLPSQFSVLAPKVREFLEKKAFGRTVDLNDPAIIKAINSSAVRFVTNREFVKALRQRIIEEVEPQLVSEGRRLSQTPAFPYSRPTIKASKCVYNLVPCDNDFERKFAKFLEDAANVERFAKLPGQFGFAIKYTDAAGNLRNYEPDFVAVLADGTHYLVETKGMEDVHVRHKDRAATLWCENATMLTGTLWRYLKVPQSDFNQLQPGDFEDIIAGFGS